MSNTARLREFRLPDVGEGLTEAEILKWYVQPGDAVHDGMVVCEVETAKAAVELPIPYDGVVQEIRFAEGDTVDVGTPIIAVDTEPGAAPEAGEPAGGTEAASDAAAAPDGGDAAAAGGAPKREPVLVGYGVAQGSTKRRPRKPQPGAEASASIQGELNGRAAPPPQAGTGTAAPAAGHGATAAGGITDMPGADVSTAEPAAPAAAAPDAPAAGGRVLAKPPVRKLAKDLGVDLAAVVPTGDGGVITRDDVHAAAAPAQAAPARPVPAAEPAAHPAPAAEPGTTARETRIPIKGVRKATAQAMVASAFTAPHVTEFVNVDVTRTMKLVRELKEDPDLAGLRINPLLIVAKALLLAIRRNPEVNSAWDEERQEIVRRHYVNLGIAAATPRGLIVPNIKDAHARSLPELATELAGLVATAREGRTTPEAMQNGSVTITNVGVFGIDTGTPILNPGEPAILAFGAIKQQPWVHKGKVKPRHVTTLALSFDHRLVDGELGSKVLADVAAVLERPKRLLTWG
ncbi:branched-chain alpha-keto acid dehydrogenase subunit E2 [Streptomyces sp. WAC 06738]|uniref:dihydrolipoamide acetyltransferase family protein n=1 Tax=Streptomyces sp. WAC 06738 TaxID=2203210 RepID=UPI000F6D39FC|nr:dihydrolipoamide acetyltransferase family protein [Streptomyces sp. WAC 06738]AZM50833.1 branched-chain alpha-keto acid dehydrogenase subunit E2 [Streptomyces sp. WAC 06738]